MMLALLAAAWASPIPNQVRPIAAPTNIVALFSGERPTEPSPLCQPLLPEHAVVCFRIVEKQKRRWLTSTDASKWDASALRSYAVARGRGRIRENIESLHVQGMPAGPASAYVQIRDGEGWAVVALLAGEVLSKHLGGGRIRVAIPRAGVVFAWADPVTQHLSAEAAAELDYILSVAVRESYDAADDAVSPMVHVWNGHKFVPFGQAKPRSSRSPE